MRVAVLALQGGFEAHAVCLRELGHEVVEIRSRDDLVRAPEGLVLPGGESTSQNELLASDLSLREALVRTVGIPVLATCAGLILATRLGWLDVALRRNAYGPQIRSEETHADDGTPLVLIRAPKIERVGPEVEVLRTFHGDPVLVRQGAVMGATFHPELTADRSVHRWVFGEAATAAPPA